MTREPPPEASPEASPEATSEHGPDRGPGRGSAPSTAAAAPGESAAAGPPPGAPAGAVAAGAAVITVAVVLVTVLARGGGLPPPDTVPLPANPHAAPGAAGDGWATLLARDGSAAERAPLRVSTSPMDFGRVTPGAVVTRTVLLANAFAEPVVIDAVRPNCGCVEVVGFETATELGPGETLALEITMESAPRQRSVRRKRLLVIPSDGERLHVPLRIETNDDWPPIGEGAPAPDAPREAEPPGDPAEPAATGGPADGQSVPAGG